jgi:hypothetical protein
LKKSVLNHGVIAWGGREVGVGIEQFGVRVVASLCGSRVFLRTQTYPQTSELT